MTTSPARLDLRDGDILKAIGILAIVLHNYFHLLPGAATENEFDFDPQRVQYFLAVVPDPRQVIQAVFSYLGHFGVQIFIFLSAYGLAMKYWTVPSWRAFVGGRLRKIYPMWFLTLGLYLLLKLVQDGPTGLASFLGQQGDELVLTTLGVLTLIPGYGLPPVGPWWFLPFIVQFYCVWTLLAWFARRFGGMGLALLSVAGVVLTMSYGRTLGQYYPIALLTTPLGHLPELCLGIAAARFGLRIGPAVVLVAAVSFLVGNVTAWWWPLTHVSVLVLMLYAYQQTAPWLRRSNVLAWIGSISMPLFFVNGFLRGIFWPLGRTGVWYLQLAGGVGVLLLAGGVAYGLSFLERRLTRGMVPS